MRRVTKPLFVAALAVGMVAGVASAAPASVSDSKKSFCKTALTLGQDIANPTEPGVTLDEDTAGDLEQAFKKLSKQAPTKALKKAAKDVASYYGQIADGESPADISTDEGEKYGEGFAKVSLYAATKCLTAAIPDITLPGGGEVDIPGLD